MRHLLIICSFLVSYSSFSQDEFMVWAELGAKGKIVKKLSWSAELNGRFQDMGVATFFPQVGVEYKLLKWLRPSIEYRFIVDQNKYGNYKATNRLNFNVSFKENVRRISFEARVRYQYGFNRVSQTAYDADFDQAIRFKPEIEYDIKKSIITPAVSAEFFYNPQYGPLTPGFTKVRLAVGAKLELDSPHGVGVKYQLDKKFRDYAAGLRHVASISYSYKF